MSSLNIIEAVAGREPLEALRNFESRVDLGNLAEEATFALLYAYIGLNAIADIMRLCAKLPAHMRRYPLVRFNHIMALALAGETEEAEVMLTRVLAAGEADANTYGLLGFIYRERYYNAAPPSRNPKWLDQAIEACQRGYAADITELYPAVNLPLLLGERNNPGDMADARHIATLLQLSAQFREDSGEHSFLNAAVGLQMTVFLGTASEEARHWSDRVKSRPAKPWMIESTERAFRRMSRLPSSDRRLWEEQVDGLATRVGRASVDTSRDPLTSAILEQTYRPEPRRSRGQTGNYRVDGIAHDVRISETDVAYFSRILEANGIDTEPDLFKASLKMNEVIHRRLHTEEMGPGTERQTRYERVMVGLGAFLGASRNDSQTNVSADWINGYADCRQHGFIKFTMLYAWKKAQLKRLLGRLDQAMLDESPSETERLWNQLKDVSSWDMHVIDTDMLIDGADVSSDYHTLTLLVKWYTTPDCRRKVTTLHWADGYRQGEVDLSQGEITHKIRDGILLLVAEPERAKTGPFKGKLIEYRASPFSFDRSRPAADFGQLHFRGIMVATPGWERDLPVDGLDLTPLHDLVAQPRTRAIKVERSERRATTIQDFSIQLGQKVRTLRVEHGGLLPQAISMLLASHSARGAYDRTGVVNRHEVEDQGESIDLFHAPNWSLCRSQSDPPQHCVLCDPPDPEQQGIAWHTYIIWPNPFPSLPLAAKPIVIATERCEAQRSTSEHLHEMITLQTYIGDDTPWTLYFHGLSGNSESHHHWQGAQYRTPIQRALDSDRLTPTLQRLDDAGRVSTLQSPIYSGIIVEGKPHFVKAWTCRIEDRLYADPQCDGAYNLALLPPRNGNTRLLVFPRRPTARGGAPVSALDLMGALCYGLPQLRRDIIASKRHRISANRVVPSQLTWLPDLCRHGGGLGD
jgi:hypothetical protein